MKPNPDPLADPRHARLLDELRALPAPEPAPGLADRVLQERSRRDRRRTVMALAFFRAAAVLAVLLAVGHWVLPRPDSRQAAATDPVAILMAAQGADGGWTAESTPLRPRYDTGMTALALLALLHADAVPLPGPRADAIRAGLDNLIRHQAPDGLLGDDFSGRGFTHYLATMALQEASRLPDADPAWDAAARRAEAHLPPGMQLASLNRHFAQPGSFPDRWADAGGPVAHAAIRMLQR